MPADIVKFEEILCSGEYCHNCDYADALDICALFKELIIDDKRCDECLTNEKYCTWLQQKTAEQTTNTLTCVYCGMAYPEGTPPHGSKVLTDHIKVCDKHPLRRANEMIGRLKSALEGLVGVSGKEALERALKDIHEGVAKEHTYECLTVINLLLELENEDRNTRS